MDDKRHWLVGGGFDLYDPANRALAEKGATGSKLTAEEVKRLCVSIVRHAQRHDVVLRSITPRYLNRHSQ